MARRRRTGGGRGDVEANLVVDVVNNVAQLLVPLQVGEVALFGIIDRLTLPTCVGTCRTITRAVSGQDAVICIWRTCATEACRGPA